MPHTTTITGDEPVTLAEAKAYLRVYSIDEDELIDNLISVAREYIETHIEKAVVEQTVTAYYDDLTSVMELPLGNATALTSITYDGSSTVTGRLLVGNPSKVVIDGELPDTSGDKQSVVIEYTAGYAAIPKRLKQACLLLVADMYEHREAQVIGQTVAQNMALERLLFPVRELGL